MHEGVTDFCLEEELTPVKEIRRSPTRADDKATGNAEDVLDRHHGPFQEGACRGKDQADQENDVDDFDSDVSDDEETVALKQQLMAEKQRKKEALRERKKQKLRSDLAAIRAKPTGAGETSSSVTGSKVKSSVNLDDLRT